MWGATLNPDYEPIEMGEGDSIVAALVKALEPEG